LLEASNGEVSFIGHGIQDVGVDRVLAHPLVMVGSDGRSMAPFGRQLERPHPRSYGTFPRALGVYCRDRGLFDLPTAIRKMTSMPADRAGIEGRGRIEVARRPRAGARPRVRVNFHGHPLVPSLYLHLLSLFTNVRNRSCGPAPTGGWG
jgi:hypothetical protein